MIKNFTIAFLLALILVSGYAYKNIEEQCDKQSSRILELFKQNEEFQIRAINAEKALARCQSEKKEIKDIKFKPAACITYQCGNPNTIARRMNNPLNIKRKYGGGKWEGEIGYDRQGHVHFKTVQHGIRAAAFVLRSYYRKHKIDNLTAIIDRFCGGNKKYVAFLSKRMHLKPTESFNVLNRMPELLRHMSQYESGKPLPEEYLVTLDVLENL